MTEPSTSKNITKKQKLLEINQDIVLNVITELNEDNGSSYKAIIKFLKINYDCKNLSAKDIDIQVKTILKDGLKNKIFKSKTNGLTSKLQIIDGELNINKNDKVLKKKNCSTEMNIKKNNLNKNKIEQKTKSPMKSNIIHDFTKIISSTPLSVQNNSYYMKEDNFCNGIPIIQKIDNNNLDKGTLKKNVKTTKKLRKSLSKNEIEKIRKSTVIRLPTTPQFKRVTRQNKIYVVEDIVVKKAYIIKKKKKLV